MNALQKIPTARPSRRKQLGNGLIYAMLGMAIVSAYVSNYMIRSQDLNVVSDGGSEGGIGNTIAAAAATYITEQYALLQPTPALAVTKNGFTLASGAVLAPTVPNLTSLGYQTNSNGVATFANGNYVIQIQRTPTGCVGPACDLSGIVYLDTPVVRNAANEINGSWIAGWLKATGSNGGYSTQANPTKITWAGGAQTSTNPVAGQPAGVVAIRFGFGSSGLGQFARLTESRAVDFQNNLQVGGTATVTGTTTINGAVTVNNGATVTGAITNGCIKTDPVGGRLGTNCFDPADVPVGSAGGIRTGDLVAGGGATGGTIGVLKNGVTGASGNFAAYLSATGDTVATGKAQGAQLVPTGFFAVGSTCTNAGALANNAGAAGWVTCQGGVWVGVATTAAVGAACSPDYSEATGPTGVKLVCLGGTYVPASSLYEVGIAGAACTTEGRQGYDSASSYTQLICRSNPATVGASLLWYRIQDLTSFKEYVGGGTYAHGTVIAKPACAAVGNTPRVAIIDFLGAGAAGSNDGAFNEKIIDNGATWTISLTNGSGQPLTSNAGFATKQVNIYCYTY